jgi:two-component system, NarL family, sensor histidine kinase DesK
LAQDLTPLPDQESGAAGRTGGTEPLSALRGSRRDHDAAEELDGESPDRMAPRFARMIVTAVFAGYCVIAALDTVSRRPGVVLTVVFVLSVAAVLTLQLLTFNGHLIRPHTRRAVALLTVQAALVYTPFLLFGSAWSGMPGFLAGGFLLLLSAPRSWVLFAAVVASMGLIQDSFTPVFINVVYTVMSTTVTGLMVFGLSRLSGLVNEVNANRMELARLAVAQERLRFSQDLHDLLGYSLSAITLKGELTRRLMESHPDRARDELIEILGISRQALEDVRSVASGYRDLCLEQEARSARSVLTAADIDVDMSLGHRPLTQQVDTVLATVLREGVTNVLGHSKAENCAITVVQTSSRIWMSVVNDGVQPEPQVPRERVGTGIGSLTSRVHALGGRLTAVVDGDRFHLTADIPR